MKRYLIALVGAVLFCSLFIPAAFADEKPYFFKLDGLRWHFAWGLDIIPSGLDITLGYTDFDLVDGLDTLFYTSLGAGYEGFETYRGIGYQPHDEIDFSTGSLNNLEFDSLRTNWEYGIVQGFLWNDNLDRNLIEGFFVYRGRFDSYYKGRIYWGTEEDRQQSILDGHSDWQTAYAGTDSEGILGNTLLIGLSSDTIEYYQYAQTYDGFYGETSFEVSPYLDRVIGASDFYRINLNTKFFKTLYTAPAEPDRSVLGIYLGNYFSIDYADAEKSMPLYVMQTFGGRTLRYGLADSLRGFEDFTWDTQFKLVNNIELRVNFPSLYFHSLVPGALCYFDIGYGSKFWEDPTGKEGALLSSAGLGLYLNTFNIVYIRVYTHFPLIGERLDSKVWNIDVSFGLHF
jgi:hypothetical protein